MRYVTLRRGGRSSRRGVGAILFTATILCARTRPMPENPSDFYWELDSIRRLLAEGGDVERLDMDGTTALERACRRRADDSAVLVRELLARGARWSDGTPGPPFRPSFARLLEHAVEGDNEDVLALLLGRESLPAASTELMLVARTDETVRLLLAAGANPDAKSYRGRAIGLQMERCWIQPTCPAAVALIAAGVDTEADAMPGKSPLKLALYYGYADVVQALAAKDVSISKLTKPQRLVLAIMLGDEQGVASLLKAGVKPESFKGHGQHPYGHRRPLQFAARLGHLDMVRRLLDAGHAPDNGWLEIPICEAARQGHVEIVRLLLASGSQYGPLALGYADKADMHELVAALVATGTSLHAALDMRVREDDLDRLRNLLALRPIAEGEFPQYWALACAARNGNRQIFETLLAAAFDLSRVVEERETLAEVAASYRHAELAAWLVEHGADPGKDRTEEALASWRNLLSAHRQDWPEWRELERRAFESQWQINKRFILEEQGGALRKGVPVELPSQLPAWTFGLVDIHAENCCPLLDAAVLGRLGKAAARDFFPEAACDILPNGFVPLQTTLSGAMIGRVSDDVMAWNPSTASFRRIGSLADFLRFCIRCTLQDSDWSSAWMSGAGAGDGLDVFDVPD